MVTMEMSFLLLLVVMTVITSKYHSLMLFLIISFLLRSEFMSPTNRNSSSSGSGLISPTNVTLSLAGSHDNTSLLASKQSNFSRNF